jgi:hypothetical protein
MSDWMPHPSTHTRDEHHNWLSRQNLDKLVSGGILVAFAVSVGHSEKEAKEMAGKVATGLAAGWGIIRAFDVHFGHLFQREEQTAQENRRRHSTVLKNPYPY